MNESRQRHVMGVLFAGIGLLTAVLAFRAHGMDAEERWIRLLVGTIFLLAGVQLAVAMRGRIAAATAGLVYTGFSAIGFILAFGHRPLEGGIPFLPAGWNQGLGHVLFGAGALVTAAAAVWFLVRAVRSPRSS